MSVNNLKCRLQHHDDQEIQFICLSPSCNIKDKFICSLCISEEHFGHQVKMINIFNEQARKLIETYGNNNESQNNITVMRNLIDDHISDIIKIFQKVKDEFLQQIDEVIEIIVKENESVQNTILQSIASIQGAENLQEMNGQLTKLLQVSKLNYIKGVLNPREPAYKNLEKYSMAKLKQFEITMRKSLQSIEKNFNQITDNLDFDSHKPLMKVYTPQIVDSAGQEPFKYVLPPSPHGGDSHIHFNQGHTDQSGSGSGSIYDKQSYQYNSAQRKNAESQGFIEAKSSNSSINNQELTAQNE